MSTLDIYRAEIMRQRGVIAELVDALKTVGDRIAGRALNDDELWGAYSQVIAAIAKAKGATP